MQLSESHPVYSNRYTGILSLMFKNETNKNTTIINNSINRLYYNIYLIILSLFSFSCIVYYNTQLYRGCIRYRCYRRLTAQPHNVIMRVTEQVKRRHVRTIFECKFKIIWHYTQYYIMHILDIVAIPRALVENSILQQLYKLYLIVGTCMVKEQVLQRVD